MAMRGRITAAFSRVLLSEAFSGVHGSVAQGLEAVDGMDSTTYDGHGLVQCNYT